MTRPFRLVNNCVLPEDLRFDVEEDLWVEQEDGVLRVGMNDHSQTIAGSIMHVNFRVEPGDEVEAESRIAVIEAAKWIGVVKPGFGGEVVEVNAELERDAELVNRSPYRRGWVARIRPSDPEAAMERFVPVAEAEELYREKMERMGLDDCVHCEEFEI